MSDSEEETVDVRPAELETHRPTPPPLDPATIAEISHLSAEIDEAEKFELTFEIVESSLIKEPETVDPNEDLEKILTPPSAKQKSRISPPLEIDQEEKKVEEVVGNEENIAPSAQRKRKSVADKLIDEFGTPPVGRKRKSLVDEPQVTTQTPLSSKKRKTK